MKPYLEQFLRVQRFLKRIENQDKDSTEHDDDLWAFFQNCWHLKDWIKWDDGNVPENIRKGIEDAVDKISSLRICADLCNRSKHLILTKHIHENAQVTERSVIVHAPVLSMDNDENAKLKCTSAYEYIITLQDGSKHDALKVARQAVKDWEKLLKELGLI